jgi:hypothetical protein
VDEILKESSGGLSLGNVGYSVIVNISFSAFHPSHPVPLVFLRVVLQLKVTETLC